MYAVHCAPFVIDPVDFRSQKLRVCSIVIKWCTRYGRIIQHDICASGLILLHCV